MKVRSQLFWGNGIIIGLFIIISIIIVTSVNKLITNSTLVTHTHNVISTTNQIMGHMVDQETGVRGFMATGNKDFLEPYHNGKRDFEGLVEKAKQLVSDNPIQVQRFAELENLGNAWNNEVAAPYLQLREGVNAGKTANTALLDFLASGEGKRRMDTFRKNWANFVKQTSNIPAAEEACWGLLLDMVNMETGMRGFLVAGKEEYLEPFNAGQGNINKRFSVLNAAGIPGTASLKADAIAWITHAGKKSIALKREALKYPTASDIENLLGQKLGKQFMDRLRNIVVKIVEMESRLLKVRKEEADSIANIAINASSGGAVIAVLSALLIVFFVMRGIMQQLGKEPVELSDIMIRVIKGDYNIPDDAPRIGVYGNTIKMVHALKKQFETAQTAENKAAAAMETAQTAMGEADAGKAEVERATQKMLRVAEAANEIADRVASASEKLSTQVELVSQGAEIQQQRVGETATAMEEMTATVIEVSRNASQASEQADNAKGKADEGAELVNMVVGSVNQINATAQTLQNNMKDLGQQADSIGGVMTVISDIADQTNLLALNAAIEAARAGDAGRGFAVVADEVRKLAEKTMAATTEVGENIRTIQTAAGTNINNVDSVVENIYEVTKLSNNSGAALSEIVSMSMESSSLISSIAAAAEQQSATTEEINGAIEEVNTIVTETTEGMLQSAQAVQELAQMAMELKEILTELRSGAHAN